jgi:hypothetical protein
MHIEMTSGGLFDSATDIQRTDPPGSDGTITLTFTSCNSGTVEYDIPSINRQGIVPIERVAGDNISLCEALDFPSKSQAQVLRPDLMYCGVSDRTGADLYLGTGPFNEVSGCVPDANTQALLVTLTGTIVGNGPAWLAFLNAGGVIISSAFVTNEIYDEVFGVFYPDTVPFGDCENNAMPSLKLNRGEPFWVANPGLTETPANATGCGSDNAAIVAGETEVTALGGLVDTDPVVVSFAVRPQGPGVFWLLEADWPGNTATVTDDSKIFMGVLIASGADVPSLIFEDGFEE